MEIDFQAEIIKALKSGPCHLVEYKDELRASFHITKRAVGHKKPYDLGCALPGSGWCALELKQVTSGDRFSFSKVKEHQYQELRLAWEMGLASGLLVNFYIRRPTQKFQREWTERMGVGHGPFLNYQQGGTNACNRAYLVPYPLMPISLVTWTIFDFHREAQPLVLTNGEWGIRRVLALGRKGMEALLV